MKPLLFIFTLLSTYCLAQYTPKELETIDSLELVIETAKDDKALITALEALSNIIYIAEPLRDIELNVRMEAMCAEGLKKATSQEEIDFYTNKRGFALNNGGAGFYYQGNYQKAIEMYTEGLELQEASNNSQGISAGLNNIGMIYIEMENFEKAKKYCEESLFMLLEMNDTVGISALYDNLGTISKELGDTVKAFRYIKDGYSLRVISNDEPGLTISANNLGNHYRDIGIPDSAQHYFNIALEVSLRIKDQSSASTAYLNLANLKLDKNEFNDALPLALLSLEYAEINSDILELKSSYELLYEVYKKLGEANQALFYHELFIDLKDEITSQENQEKVISEEFRYEYEKQAAQDSIQNAEANKVKDAELDAEKAKTKQQEQQTYFLYVGLTLALLFGGFIFNRFRVTQKQKGIIEEQKTAVELAHKETERQKHLIEEAHTEITDSINYAKRLQDAILPSFEEVNKALTNNFILFKPKDVVSGDFYWFEELEGTTYIAAADCTGHGVPGAMVSVVCSNALNRTVKEFGITEPAQILNKTRELVIETFAKRGEEVKDGMDIALCAFREDKVIFAGANNPLWMVRKTSLLTNEQREARNSVIEGELALIEFKANKQPVGLYSGMKEFTQENIQLHQGDTLYFFTDGLADQFGGPKGKKFKYKPFKKLLISLNSESMQSQETLLSEAFEKWKGDIEQVDDLCVIGVRV